MMDCENNVSFFSGLVSAEHILNVYRSLLVRTVAVLTESKENPAAI
jgi:hypothetical protein